MTNRFIFAVMSYIVITFAIAFPWHFIWFKELIHELGIYNKSEPIFALGILSMLIQGSVMAYLYPYVYKGGHPVGEGITFGLMMGVFLFSVSTLANAAKIDVSSISTFVLIQAAFHAIQFTLAGAAIGLIYGRRSVKLRIPVV